MDTRYDGRYLQEALTVVETVFRDARPKLVESYGQVAYEEKVDKSAVTELDTWVEGKLHDALLKFDESAGFYGEETGRSGNHETFWLVDPIDGTECFVRGLPYCTNMAALIHDGEPVVSIIYNFVNDEMFTAIKGAGAYKNGIPIRVSDRMADRSLVYVESKEFSLVRDYAKPYGITCLTAVYSAGHFFTLVAEGKVEGCIRYEGYGKSYDYAPGALLIQEAGGIAMNIGSSTYDYTNLNFVAANKHVIVPINESLSNATSRT